MTAPVASDTSTPETTITEVTTSETEGTTSVSETEGTDVNTVFQKTIELTDDGDLVNDEEFASVIESLEAEGYSFEGITGAIEDEDSGSKKFIIVNSDGQLQTVFVGEDGTATINSEDLLIEFEDKLESVDITGFDETVISDSSVIVYSVEFTDGAYNASEDHEDIFEEDFPISIAQG